MTDKDYFSQDILEDAISERQKARAEKRAPLITKKQQAESEEKKQAKEENRKKRKKFLFVVIAALLIIVTAFGNKVYRIYQLSKEKEAAEAKLASINYNIGKLEEELTRIKNPEYIEHQARNQLRMIYPGEILYIILENQNK